MFKSSPIFNFSNHNMHKKEGFERLFNTHKQTSILFEQPFSNCQQIVDNFLNYFFIIIVGNCGDLCNFTAKIYIKV